MREFKEAVEARDMTALASLFAPDIEFFSPVSFKPFRGRDQVGMVLAMVSTVFEDFVYTASLGDGPSSALVFRTRISGREAEGIDLIERNERGEVARLTVMIRPLSALNALAEAMRVRLAGHSK